MEEEPYGLEQSFPTLAQPIAEVVAVASTVCLAVHVGDLRSIITIYILEYFEFFRML